MPTYEYKCLDCGTTFETFQSMTEDPLTTCHDCGGRLKRLIGSGAGIIFKGSGFYCTDYRSSSYQNQAQNENKTPSSDAASKKPAESKKAEVGASTSSSAKTEKSGQ